MCSCRKYTKSNKNDGIIRYKIEFQANCVPKINGLHNNCVVLYPIKISDISEVLTSVKTTIFSTNWTFVFKTFKKTNVLRGNFKIIFKTFESKFLRRKIY